METINHILRWYQTKIGSHDKFTWESSTEERVLRSIQDIPKKAATFKSQLIDVDLVDGSTFFKAKHSHAWPARTWKGLIRLLCMPMFFGWWRQHTSLGFALSLLAIYIFQFIAVVTFAVDSGASMENLSAWEVVNPLVLMFVLSVVHTQIVFTQSNHHSYIGKKARLLEKKKRRQKASTSTVAGINSGCTGSSAKDKRRRVAVGEKVNGEVGSTKAIDVSALPSAIVLGYKCRSNGMGGQSINVTTATSCNASTDSSDEMFAERNDGGTSSVGTMSPEATVTDVVHLPDLEKACDVACDPDGMSLAANGFMLNKAVQMNGGTLAPNTLPLISSAEGLPLRDGGTTSPATHQQLCPDFQRIAFAPLMSTSTKTDGLGQYGSGCKVNAQQHVHRTSSLRHRHKRPLETGAVTSAGLTSIASTRQLDLLRVCPESTATSDVDTPSPASLLAKVRHASASEWESNRMHSSDVNSTDSSSECSVIDEDGGSVPSGSGRRRRRRPPPVSVAVAAAATAVTELPPAAAAAVVYIPSAYDRISCIMWEEDLCKKADLSVIDIGVIIDEKVEQIRPNYDYVLLAVIFVLLFSSTPFMFRAYHSPTAASALIATASGWTSAALTAGNWTEHAHRIAMLANIVRCDGACVCFVLANSLIQRVYLSSLFMFLLAVAERTYWQRLLYAKHFSYLTSARRSRKYDVPHFRLNKVKNIKTWLSLRSFLKRRGPQRSVDVIVSAAFVLLICLLALMCVQLLRDHEAFLAAFANWELTVFCLILSVFLLRYYGLGSKINKKYRNLSILITEEINLYLQMEQKPHKKDDLMVANAVLKLAVDLIKEVESPFKMSNFNVNPVVFSVTKVIMLSAFSAVLTELFGFKLKLHKVKI